MWRHNMACWRGTRALISSPSSRHTTYNDTPDMDPRPRNEITYSDTVLLSSPLRSSHAISPVEALARSQVHASLSLAAVLAWWGYWPVL